MFIRFIRGACCAAVLAVLTACASVQPTLEADAVPDAQAAYVSGEFTRVPLTGIAYVVESMDGSNKYLLPMGKDTPRPSAVDRQTVAMKIPPGTYHIVQWVTYATLTKEVFIRSPVANPWMRAPFTLKAGTVFHLGRFTIEGGKSYSYPSVHFEWAVKPQPVLQSEALAAFSLTYPKLAELPFGCLLCSDSVSPVTSSLLP